MTEPICFPVCIKCQQGCWLRAKSQIKSTPKKHVKKKWQPDVIVLACGQIASPPIVWLGTGKVWCETHGTYERQARKTKKKEKYPRDPLF